MAAHLTRTEISFLVSPSEVSHVECQKELVDHYVDSCFRRRDRDARVCPHPRSGGAQRISCDRHEYAVADLRDRWCFRYVQREHYEYDGADFRVGKRRAQWPVECRDHGNGESSPGG